MKSYTSPPVSRTGHGCVIPAQIHLHNRQQHRRERAAALEGQAYIGLNINAVITDAYGCNGLIFFQVVNCGSPA